MNRKRKTSIILGIISILYYIMLYAFGGRISFSGFWLVVGVIFIAVGWTDILHKVNILFKVKGLRVLLYLIITLGVGSFLIIESFIIYYGSEKSFKESDYLLILGAGLRGEQLSMTLHQRMIKGMEFLEKYPNTKVIVSGGQGPGEDITEAEAMKRYLISNGISENQIIKEEKSTSTEENLIYSREVIKKLDSRDDMKITLITTNFHMFRSKFLANRFGLDVYSAPSDLHPLLIPNYYVREYLAVINSYLFNRG